MARTRGADTTVDLVRSMRPFSITRYFALLQALILAVTALGVTALFSPYLLHNDSNEQLSRLQLLANGLRNQVATAIRLSQDQVLTTLVEQARESLITLAAKNHLGSLSRDEAQWLAADLLTGTEVGQDGYIFVLNSRGRVMVHPDRALLGRDLSQLEPVRLLLDHRLEQQRMERLDFFPLGAELSSQPLEMLSSHSYFQHWDWLVVAVIPWSSAAQLVDFPAIEQSVMPPPGLEQALPFLLYPDGRLWCPPSSGPGPAEQLSPLIKTIQSQREGSYSYDWMDQSGDTPRKNTLFFHEIKGAQLIVGMAGPTSGGLSRLLGERQGLLVPALLLLLLLPLLATLAAALLSRPFRRFAGHTLEQSSKEEAIQVSRRDPAELQQVAWAFNTLLERLEQSRLRTEQELEISEAVHRQLSQEVLSREQAQQQLLAEISTRKSAQNYLQLFKNIFDNAIEGIIITDSEAKILAVNQSFSDITGYQAEEAIGKNPNLLNSGKQSKNFYRKLWESLRKRGSWSGEIWNRKKDGTIWPEWLSISEIRDGDSRTSHYFAFFHDISELKRREKQISIMAYRDALTKLPNRAALESRLTKAIARAKREAGILAVLFIDLDNFKNINDTLGHDKGDQLLILVAERIGQTIRSEDTLSRLGGDEFILLSESIENESRIFNLAGRILHSLKHSFTIGAGKLFINASIGISTYPNDGQTTSELIKNADLAMYRAKKEGKNKFVMFTQEMHEKFLAHVRIENSIRIGLEQREFLLYYQPKIDIVSQQPTSLEALIRWEKNGLIITPDKFIPVAEESGLIDQMSLYVLEEVCIFLNSLKGQAMPMAPVSVNMAPRTFNNLDIVETIDAILERHRIDHRYIDFEVTETTAMQDIQHTLSTMNRFRQRGISFSIDDFGTGYSSLSYLNEMPVSTLKIDKRFISAEDSNSRSIVSTITAMAKQMELKVVAEGVETMEQLNWLQTLGCHEAQGYYFSRPLPEKEIIRFLRGAAEECSER